MENLEKHIEYSTIHEQLRDAKIHELSVNIRNNRDRYLSTRNSELALMKNNWNVSEAEVWLKDRKLPL